MGKGVSKLIIIGIFLILTITLSSCYKTEYIFDESTCKIDNDCVRQASCCDCDIGEYVNKQYFKDILPENCAQKCDCEPILTVGMCIDNTCKAIKLEDEFCDNEGKHRLGDTWRDEEEICTCNENRKIICDKDPIKAEAKDSLDTYYQKIDYSCEQDSDCMVKDIHNCCGYYPKCVNYDFETNPELVNELCKTSDASEVCGFPTINSCACVDGKCKGIV